MYGGPTFQLPQRMADPVRAGIPSLEPDYQSAILADLRVAAGSQFIDPNAEGTDAFIKHPGFTALADGTATFSGSLSAPTISGGTITSSSIDATNSINAGAVNAGTMSAARIQGGTIGAITITASSSIAAEAITAGTISSVTLSSGTISGGSISGATIDIGGADATSWHVDSDGNMWWGDAGSYAAATFKISSEGLASLDGIEVDSLDIGGSDATSWHVDTDGNMWWGSAGSYAAATVKISNTGTINFTAGTFAGAVEASSIDIGGSDATSWHVDGNGNMWWGSSGTYAGATIKISSTGSVDFTSGTFGGTVSSTSFTGGTATFTGNLVAAGELWSQDILRIYTVDLRTPSTPVAWYPITFDSQSTTNEVGLAVMSLRADNIDADAHVFEITTTATNLKIDTDSGTGGSAGGDPVLQCAIDAEFDEDVTVTGALEVDGALNHDGTTAGFYAATPVTKQTVGTGLTLTNNDHGNAIYEIADALEQLGLVTNAMDAP